MRYALIIAGGSGTRLWPMSRANLPKQLIPFLDGQSLLQLAYDRLDGLVPPAQRYVCASQQHADRIQRALGLPDPQFLGEPIGRDTLNAIGLTAAVMARRDPAAVFAVFTADHVIEPVPQFQEIVARGFRLAEESSPTLVTFGITPTHAVLPRCSTASAGTSPRLTRDWSGSPRPGTRRAARPCCRRSSRP